jgi:cystathionine beta-lyase
MNVDRWHFDEVLDRASSNSMKWAGAEEMLTPAQAAAGPLPMWVADTDFKAPEALHGAIEYGVFGYPAGPSTAYLDAVVGWQARRFGWEVPREWVLPTAGVITTLKTAVQAFSAPGDTVLIQPPVYAHFHNDVLLNGRHLALAPLERVDDGYRLDLRAFEAAIRPNTKLFILSHPHNPTGNVWSEDELRAMGEICAHHGVLVISDEITKTSSSTRRSDTSRSRPSAPSSPRAASPAPRPARRSTCPGSNAPTCSCPTAGCVRSSPASERNLFPVVNLLGMVAAEAAYAHGEPWLEELLPYLRANHSHFAEAINGATTAVRVLPADSLYLAWMDCRGLGLDAEALNDFMLTQARVWFDRGQKFGLAGHGYMRVNLGCPRSTLDEAIRRLSAALGQGRGGSTS